MDLFFCFSWFLIFFRFFVESIDVWQEATMFVFKVSHRRVWPTSGVFEPGSIFHGKLSQICWNQYKSLRRCALQFRIKSLREHGPASPNPAHVDILSIEKLIHFEAWGKYVGNCFSFMTWPLDPSQLEDNYWLILRPLWLAYYRLLARLIEVDLRSK